MVVFQDELGLLFWPEEQVAALTPEFRGRWRGVMADGTVAHRPGPPPEGPWVPLGGSLVMPSLLKRTADGWLDPADFPYPPEALPDVPEPPVEELIEGLGCRPDQVLCLKGVGNESCTWTTALGEVTWPMSVREACLRHPGLVKVRVGVYLNRRRLRRLGRDGLKFLVLLDDGSTFDILQNADLFAQELGLENPSFLDKSPLYRRRLRDYPVELATASAAYLRAHFDCPKQLIGNLLYQAVRYREMGIAHEYGTSHRGFWYLPVFPTLHRAGFADARSRLWADGDQMILLYRRTVEEIIGDERLFTFRDLGFEDPKQREIGDRLPHVVVLVEKESLLSYARQLAATFGVTLYFSGGATTLIDTEFLVDALRPLLDGRKLIVIAYVDYDPAGWALADGFLGQLLRYAMACETLLHLVVASCFTEEEISLYAMPCPGSAPISVTLAKHWVERCGGIHGEAMGIHANHLRPLERVLQRMRELL